MKLRHGLLLLATILQVANANEKVDYRSQRLLNNRTEK